MNEEPKPPSVEVALEPATSQSEPAERRDEDEAVPGIAPADEAEIDPLDLDPDGIKVLSRLHQYGHEAYFVGGCVRDLLLGRRPKDFDICTSAHPNDVRGIFRNCRLIGRRFRLAHIYFRGGKIIEVSTFRANPAEVEDRQQLEDDVAKAEAVELGDDPAPAETPVAPSEDAAEDFLITQDNVFGTAEEDARRRDFTINGLFYDVTTGRVIDYVRGRRDLDERFIRTIGDPERRMREDPVRILRAVRFAAKLDFDIESRTYAAMEGAVEDLPRCSPPRLLEETFRLIRGGAAAPSLKLLAALDALKMLLPPVDAFLRQLGREREREFYAYAEALDRHARVATEPLDDAVVLAAILLPISRASASPETPDGRVTVAPAIEDLLAELVRSARLPRRIAERCRLILIAQRTLAGERRRRGPLGAFRQHPLFRESLAVFEMMAEATGQYAAELAAWKAGEAPQIKPTAEGGGRRRRRRRRGAKGPQTEGAPKAGTDDT